MHGSWSAIFFFQWGRDALQEGDGDGASMVRCVDEAF